MTEQSLNTSPRLLILDDDEVYSELLSRAMSKRGYQVVAAYDLASAVQLAGELQTDFAIVDLRINKESGLDAVKSLKEIHTSMHIVVLTGYASIVTAVQAIKLGAAQYLTKPAEVEDIMRALQREQEATSTEISGQPLSPRRMEWEHLQKVLHDHQGNISSAARVMGMHRRTLQRKLNKKPVGH